MKRTAHNKITFVQDGIEIPMTPKNRWKLIQEVLDPTKNTVIKGDNETWVNNYIGTIKKKFPQLTVELVAEYRTLKKSGAQLCRDFKINPNSFVAFCRFYQVSCDFTQCPLDIKAKLESKTWLEESIKNKNSEILAVDLGVSPSLVLQYLHKHDIDWERGGRSRAEIELETFIKNIYSGPVISNVRNVIPPKEIDVFLPELMIGFEMNGIYYHSWDKTRHQIKSKEASKQGIRIIHITDFDWDSKRTLIQKKISHILGVANNKVFARNTTIKKATNAEIRAFVNDNHIYGHKNCQHCYCLEHNGNIVAVITFTKNHLERFCSSVSVVGGFSKLFKTFLTDVNPDKVISYCDLRYGNGKLYESTGFTLEAITEPDYW